jgi:protein-disulfide isomerase
MDAPEPLPPSPSPADETVTFRRSHLYAALLPLAFVVGIAVGYLMWGRAAPAAAPSAAAQTSGAQQQAASGDSAPQKIKRYPVPEDGNPSIGPKDAKITIIEFSDYQCPYCKQWYNDVYLKLLQTYPEQVRIVYRDFPLDSIHPNARPAAVAAYCGGQQDAYFKYHDALFGGKYGLDEAGFKKIASDLGIDSGKFETCLKSDAASASVEKNYQYAANLGVQSTPTFFINGIPLVGAQPFDVFKQVIDQELAGKLQ